MSDLAWMIVAAVVKSAILIVALLTAFAYMTLIERRVLARFQRRLGPNRAGPFGLFQPIADALKMAFKEQILPTRAKRLVFLMAPAHLRLHRADRLRRDSAGQPNGLGRYAAGARLGAAHRRCQRRHPLHSGGLIAGGLWHRACGLVVGQPLLAARRAALGGADGLV